MVSKITLSLVSSVTVGVGGAASIEFTGIPQGGQDLMVVFSGRDTNAGTQNAALVEVNALSGTYTGRSLDGNGATASSQNFLVTGYVSSAGSTSNTFGNNSFYFSKYAGSQTKSYSIDAVTENNATTAYQSILAASINTTSPITSISIKANGGTFVQYSTASLYTISTTGATGAVVA